MDEYVVLAGLVALLLCVVAVVAAAVVVIIVGCRMNLKYMRQFSFPTELRNRQGQVGYDVRAQVDAEASGRVDAGAEPAPVPGGDDAGGA